MGYRLRLGCVNKGFRQEVAGLSIEEIYKVFGEDFVPYRPHKQYVQIYELEGMSCDKKHLEDIYDFDIFTELEAEFHIISKEGLLEIIDQYREYSCKMYSDLLKETKDAVDKHLQYKKRMWSGKEGLPYYLDETETDGQISKSWRFEYAIFNLIYIYRTFDWNNNYLIYSGY